MKLECHVPQKFASVISHMSQLGVILKEMNYSTLQLFSVIDRQKLVVSMFINDMGKWRPYLAEHC